TPSAPASRSSVPTSTSAGSTTAAIWPSPDAPCGRPGRQRRSTSTGSSPTSVSTRRSARLPGPAAGVADGDLGHHLRERLVEVDLLRVGDANDHKQDVRQLHGDRADLLVGPLGLGPEMVIDLARQLANFFREPRDIGEGGEIALLELADPTVDGILRFAKAHGDSG